MITAFRKIKELWTFQGLAAKDGRKPQWEDLTLIKDGAIISSGDNILWIGADAELNQKLLTELKVHKIDTEFFFKDKIIIPAFVECHTHSIFAGDRSKEFELRNQGVSYQGIAASGGGIVNTVHATREISKKNLLDLTQKRVTRFLQQGVGTLEIKTGYGLDDAQELRLLQILTELEGPEIVPTYLGPHAYPNEINEDEYKNQILTKTLSQVVHRKLAQRVDVFIESKYFDLDFAKKYFEKAQSLGLQISAHVDQFSNLGGSKLAIECGAKSIEHVLNISDLEIDLLAKSQTTAVLLPIADMYLKINYPKARKMIDEGCRIALSTDFNPGSAPSQDLSLVGVLARLEMKMTLPEVLAAYTFNAASALSLQRGFLATNTPCNFLVMDDELGSLFYSVGYHPVAEVWLRGQLQYKKN